MRTRVQLEWQRFGNCGAVVGLCLLLVFSAGAVCPCLYLCHQLPAAAVDAPPSPACACCHAEGHEDPAPPAHDTPGDCACGGQCELQPETVVQAISLASHGTPGLADAFDLSAATAMLVPPPANACRIALPFTASGPPIYLRFETLLV